MDHIELNKLEIYFRDKSSLGDEAFKIEAHINECTKCSENLKEVVLFYQSVESSEKIEVKYSEIQNMLGTRKKEQINDIKSIFQYSTTKVTSRKSNNESTGILVWLKGVFFQGSHPGLRIAVSAGIILIILVAIYGIIKLMKPSVEYTKDLKIDSTSQQKNPDEIITNIPDSVNNQVEPNKDSSQINKKHENNQKDKIKKQYYGSIAMIMVSGLKGGYDRFDFVKAVQLRSSSAVLFVYGKGILDTIKKGYSFENLILENKDSYRILFPKTGLFQNDNFICKIIPDKDYELDVYVTENTIHGNCEQENEAAIYHFDSNMNLKRVDFSDKFVETYKNKHSLEKSEINSALTILSDRLQQSIKYWNGKEFSTQYFQK